MNDDELGRALGTALAAPDVTAVPDAGARLRSRAHRASTERLAVGGAVVVVLAVLLGVGVVRGIGGGGPATPTAAPATGYRLLTTPLTINKVGPEPSPGPCTAGAELRCGPAALVVDEVAGLSTTYLLERGAVIEITLTATDAATLRAVATTGPDRMVSVRVGQGGYVAAVDAGRLRIPMPSAHDADVLVAELGPVRPAAPRTGPGRLDLPLQVWTVRESEQSPCTVAPAKAGVLVVNRGGECLVLAGPELTIDSADLQLVPPSDVGQDWLVSVEPAEPAAGRFEAYTARHVGDRAAFVAGGHLLSSPPTLQSRISGSFEIAAGDRAAAEALITRLRR